MHGFDILCGISKVPFEIPLKLSQPYNERCRFYELLDLRAHKCFCNPPPPPPWERIYVSSLVQRMSPSESWQRATEATLLLMVSPISFYLSIIPLSCFHSSIHIIHSFIIPPEQRSCWGVYWFHSVRLSVRPSVRPSVRLSRLPCPLCNIYSSGWILSILATNDHYHERVCRTQWPLTLTYIFKVIRPWLRKPCPLCSVYSSGWILLIFGTNDHYH